MAKKQDKIKILVWGDSPATNTGFGVVMRGVFGELAKTDKYEIDIVGINDTGGYKNPEKYKNMRIYPAVPGISNTRDFHGRERLVNAVFGKDREIRPTWDIVFTLNDPFILDLRMHQGRGTMDMLVRGQIAYMLNQPPETWFKIVSYFPVDSRIKSNWVKDTIALPDQVVAYTEYGKKEILDANKRLSHDFIHDLEKRMSVIYHGVNQNEFYPISDEEKSEFRKTYFDGKITDETFLVSIVGRNQMRKDIPRAMKIFREFKKRRPDSFLYINSKLVDVWGSLEAYGQELGLEFGKDYGVPGNFNANTGLKVNTLNKIYNVSDVLLSANLGEGWGLSYSEAMATKTINLAPFNTTVPELFNLNSSEIDENARGIGYKSGSTKSEWAFFGPEDLNRERPLANVEDGVKKLMWIYDNPDKVAIMEERAYEWISQYTWKKIAGQWDKLFQETYQSLKKDRSNSETIKKDLIKKLGLDQEQDAST